MMSELEERLQTIMSSYPDDRERMLLQNKQLISAASPFVYRLYAYEATRQLADSRSSSTTSCHAGLENLLLKHGSAFCQTVIQTIEHFAQNRPVFAWLSETLPWDLNLPMTSQPPAIPGFVQAFVLCDGQPPFVLSIYDHKKNLPGVTSYTRDTARLLTWSLLGFCHLDFTVLPCVLLRHEFNLKSMKKVVDSQCKIVTRYFSKPLLDEDKVNKLKEATTALAGSTLVASFLSHTGEQEAWQLLMDKERMDVMSLLIERLHKEEEYKVVYSLSASLNVKVVTALDVAQRLSFSTGILVTCSTDEVYSCLRKIEQNAKVVLGVSLKLSYQQIVNVAQQDETASIVVEMIRTESQHQHFLKSIKNGHLPDVCLQPSNENPAFLQFRDFCSQDKATLQLLLKAEDTKHGLPLLYWSFWSPCPEVTPWILAKMAEIIGEDETQSTDLFFTTLAGLILTSKNENTDRLVQLLRNTENTDTNQKNFKLPFPRIPETEEAEAHHSKLKKRSLCYLDDPSLPIPATLLSVTVTEDAVSVELPSQHWYLALRLLADRELDETDRDGNTLLHIAADKGNLEAITLAVKSGASLAKTNKDSLTPYELAQNRQNAPDGSRVTTAIQNLKLHYACCTDDLIEAKTALCFGAEVFCKGEKGNVPLHTACEVGSVKTARLLLKLGAKTEEQNAEGSTPLHVACESGQKAIVELLLQSNAAENTKNYDGNVALHLASKSGHTEIAKILLESSDEMLIDIHNSGGFTPLHFACESGHLETAKMLLEKHAHVDEKSSCGYTPLHLACKKGLNQMADLLINQGADVNAVTKTGLTPLKLACQKDNEQGKDPCQDKANVPNKIDVVKLLLEHRRIDITIQDNYGRTALHEACLTGDDVVVRLLLKHFQDKDITIQDNYGRTALHEACLTGDDVVRQLLEHFPDIDITIQDSDGRTAMHEACKAGKPKVLGLLLKHGQDIDINKQDYNDRTVLHDACSSGESSVVKQLLEHFEDIDINKKDIDGRTALHEACAVGKHEVVRLLLKHGQDIDINYEDHNRRTALHEACSAGSVVVVKQLLGHFQDIKIDIQDNKCRTAVDIARPCNKIVLLLEQYKAGCQPPYKLKLDSSNIHQSSSIKKTHRKKDVQTYVIK